MARMFVTHYFNTHPPPQPRNDIVLITLSLVVRLQMYHRPLKFPAICRQFHFLQVPQFTLTLLYKYVSDYRAVCSSTRPGLTSAIPCVGYAAYRHMLLPGIMRVRISELYTRASAHQQTPYCVTEHRSNKYINPMRTDRFVVWKLIIFSMPHMQR